MPLLQKAEVLMRRILLAAFTIALLLLGGAFLFSKTLTVYPAPQASPSSALAQTSTAPTPHEFSIEDLAGWGFVYNNQEITMPATAWQVIKTNSDRPERCTEDTLLLGFANKDVPELVVWVNKSTEPHASLACALTLELDRPQARGPQSYTCSVPRLPKETSDEELRATLVDFWERSRVSFGGMVPDGQVSFVAQQVADGERLRTVSEARCIWTK